MSYSYRDSVKTAWQNELNKQSKVFRKTGGRSNVRGVTTTKMLRTRKLAKYWIRATK